MTKDDLINALVKVFKMTISKAENITGLGNIEGDGRIVYGDVVLNNIEELQNDGKFGDNVVVLHYGY